MSDFAPLSTRSRGRSAWIVALVLLAFAAGLAVATYAIRHADRLGERRTQAAPQPSAQPAPSVAARATAGAATPLAAAIDPATLATREAVLAAQLAALEARTAAVRSDAVMAEGQAGRAESMLVAFAARRAIDRGLDLGYLDGELRRRFGASQPMAVAVVIEAARQHVVLGDLRQGLDAIAPDVATGTAADGWFASFRRQLSGLVVLRKAGMPSPLPADRLARARRLLDGGQVEAARAEVARLPGAAAAGNWMAAAQRYVRVRHALDRIEEAAITGQGAPQPGQI